ncbi:hypothetical protein [Actinocorallia sp. A-T 12471]|uniref:hypothetical protein n=1 Tax=Actinocorallia sp. A-T 12471 TaxID=3089813 RepID=UPI0029CAF7D3|nr:hypothetical protein [Actinocorallia sp. A-T 12471]MDX6742279.1 hypothetical protein [Actinocorallia sp. A-T 12471]
MAKGPRLRWIEDVVWTGSEVIAFGSDGGHELVGVAYSPADDRWRRLSASGVSADLGHVVVWDSGLVFLVSPYPDRVDGGEVNPFPEALDPGGVYDPANDRWSALPVAEGVAVSSATGAVTGKGVVFWDGVGDAAVFDLEGRRWSALKTPRQEERDGGVPVWTGSELIIWGGDGCGPLAKCAGPIPPPDPVALTP